MNCLIGINSQFFALPYFISTLLYSIIPPRKEPLRACGGGRTAIWYSSRITGTTFWGDRPCPQHQRPFENKPPGMWGLRQPVEKSFHRIILEQFIERTPVVPCHIEKFLPHRRRNVSGRCSSQVMASRYGFMTFSIRQILAYKRISFGLIFFCPL